MVPQIAWFLDIDVVVFGLSPAGSSLVEISCKPCKGVAFMSFVLAIIVIVALYGFSFLWLQLPVNK